MKASRLLHLLLLLQTRQRITTTELAERLEVSRRTVLRDVESLSGAGVPVFAERGRNGGIVLLPGARLNVSHLEPAELEALSVAGLDSEQRGLLGLAETWNSVRRKVDARQVESSNAPGALRLSDFVLVENDAWLGQSKSAVDISGLATVLRQRRRLRIRYRHSAERNFSTLTVDPYGMVAKSGRWYLVADNDGAGQLFALGRLSSYEQLDALAVVRPEENLKTVWDALKAHTERPGNVRVTVRMRESRLDLASRILGERIQSVSEGDDDGWRTVVVRYSEIEAVRQLLQFGDHLEVLAPEAARRRVAELASDLFERHSKRTT